MTTAPVCHWHQDSKEGCCYETDCGRFVATDNAEDVTRHHCLFCGRVLVEVPWGEDEA